MRKPHKLFVIIGIILLVVVIFIVSVFATEPWLLSNEDVAIHVVIDNRTNDPIGPFFLSDKDDSGSFYIDQIEPLSVMDAYFTKSGSAGENEIVMTDSDGRKYSVVPYFENEQKGRIDIRVECLTAEGLSGKKRDLISWYFSFEWHPWWGTSVCD